MEDRKVYPRNQVTGKEGTVISFVAAKEKIITPSDTNPISREFNGCSLFVNITEETVYDVGVEVTLSLVSSPTVFIKRKLQHGYHPLAVHQIKETGTDTMYATFIGQI